MKKLHLLALTMLFSTCIMVQAGDFGSDDYSSDNSMDNSSTASQGGASAKVAAAKAKFATMKTNSTNMTPEQKQAAFKAALAQKMQGRSGNIANRQQKMAAFKANNAQQASFGSASSDDSESNVVTQGAKAIVYNQNDGDNLPGTVQANRAAVTTQSIGQARTNDASFG